MQGSVTGRLLSYSPKTKKTHVLAGDLFYANGVVVAHDQSFLLVVETMSVTIHKYWLQGPKVHEHVSKHTQHQALNVSHCLHKPGFLCLNFFVHRTQEIQRCAAQADIQHKAHPA
jgi:sugar lactone lactonase YvrE